MIPEAVLIQPAQPISTSSAELRRMRKAEAARLRYAENVPKVNPRELALFREDPYREEKRRISDYVVCRECGAKCKRLIGGWDHLKFFHLMTAEDYNAKWPGAPVYCWKLRQEAPQRLRTVEKRGVPRPNLTVRAHPDEKPASKWAIACAVVNGKSSEAAGREVNRSRKAVQAARLRMGLSDGYRALYDFGEPVTAEYVKWLQQASGLSVQEFAEQVGMSSDASAIRPPQGKSRSISPRQAEKVIRWRDERLRNLLQSAPNAHHEADRYSGSQIIKTFFPRLQRNYQMLRELIPLIRAYVSEHAEEGPADLGEYICHQAMLETAGKSKKRIFEGFLPWAAGHRSESNKTLLERHWNLFREPGYPLSLAFKILSAELGTTPAVVDNALRSRTFAIRPRDMRTLLLVTSSVVPQVARPTNDASAKRGPKQKNAARDFEADRLHREQHRSWPQIAALLTPVEYDKNPMRAAEKIRQGAIRFRKRHPKLQ